jgi:arylsulfatase A-like enzyme
MRALLRRVVALAAASAAAACAGATRPQGILLITLDTTRADRLGCYGYDRAETSNLDRLAAGAVLFRNAQAPVPVTLPSHASMFTGAYPPVHGIRYNGMFKLPEASVTIAELLRDAGWSTAGMPAGFPLNADTGIGQGFETYHDMFRGIDPNRFRWDRERPARETTDLGIEFLRRSGEKPFFLWLHYWDPHDPYHPPFPFSGRFRDRPYDGEVAYVDQELGRLFEAAQQAGLWDRLLVVVAGDHGEGLYDHNEKLHAHLVYQSTLHVPLIVKPPGRARPRVVDEPVSLVDVAPTVLDFAAVAGPEMEGVSLKPAVYGRTLRRRDLYFESLAGSLVHGWSPLEGIRRGAWKYTRSSAPELFDLASDPGEIDNRFERERALAFEMEQELQRLEDGWRARPGPASAAFTPVDPAQAEMLAALGYLGGFVTEQRRAGPHPRDRIHLDPDTLAARDLALQGEHEEVLRRLEAVLSQDPGDRYALHGAAMAAANLRDFERALGYTRRLLEIYPEFTPGRILQGEIHVVRGELEKAAEEFRKGLEHRPEDAGLQYRLAVVLYALGRPAESLEIADRMIAKGAELPSFLVQRAACRAKLGDPEGSLASLREAIGRGYRDREVLLKEPLLAPLRAVPGFDEVIQAIPAS